MIDGCSSVESMTQLSRLIGPRRRWAIFSVVFWSKQCERRFSQCSNDNNWRHSRQFNSWTQCDGVSYDTCFESWMMYVATRKRRRENRKRTKNGGKERNGKMAIQLLMRNSEHFLNMSHTHYTVHSAHTHKCPRVFKANDGCRRLRNCRPRSCCCGCCCCRCYFILYTYLQFSFLSFFLLHITCRYAVA